MRTSDFAPRLAAFAIVLAAPLAGCSSKGADCATFAKTANENVAELKKADPKDNKQLHAAVKKVADSAKRIQVKDEGLAPMVKEYAAVWERGATASANLESTNEATSTKAIADIDAVEKEESAIVDKINAYCK